MGIAEFGYLGVTFFFVLSGFVLVWSWRPTVDRRTFWWRRFSRIYPLAFVTLLVAIPVFTAATPPAGHWWVRPLNLGALLLSFLLLQGWSRNPDILFAGNPAAWTLSVEGFFYAAHPFLMVAIRRFSRRGALTAACIVILSAFGVQWLGITGGWIAAAPLPLLHINEFIIGMCLAWAFRQGWLPHIPVSVPVAAVAGWIGTIMLTAHGTGVVGGIHHLAALYTAPSATVFCALLVVATAAADIRGRTRLLVLPAIVRLGDWSYAFYLVHGTLIYIALGLFGVQPRGMRTLAWAVVLLVASILAAATLHLGVERPLERRMRRWQTERRERTAVAVSG